MLLPILSRERLFADTVRCKDICCDPLNDAAVITYLNVDQQEEATDSCKQTFTFWAPAIGGIVSKVSYIFQGVSILNYVRVDRRLD